MTEIPPPNGSTPTSSVVIDSDASLPPTNRGAIVAIVVGVLLVGAFVVWLVAAGGEDDYEPGPVAQAFVKGFEESGIDAELSGDELQCIDEAGEGLDPTLFESEALDVLGEMPDPETIEAVGTMFDDCLHKETRVAMFTSSLTEEGDLDEEQASCIAEKIDDAFMEAGGYSQLLAGGEGEMGDVVFSMFGAFGECGVELGDMMG